MSLHLQRLAHSKIKKCCIKFHCSRKLTRTKHFRFFNSFPKTVSANENSPAGFERMAGVPRHARCGSSRAVRAWLGTGTARQPASAANTLPGTAPELLPSHSDPEPGVRDSALSGAGDLVR